MKYLIITLRGARFDAAVIPAHYRFPNALRDQGALEQAGPFSDGAGGAYVLSAQDQDEARRIAELDPLSLMHCSRVRIHEWDAR